MNFVLGYLLIINFAENQTSQNQAIQTVIKDKIVIDYVKFGYPMEFLFRIVSNLFMWRIYQFSRLKSVEYEYADAIPNDDV